MKHHTQIIKVHTNRAKAQYIHEAWNILEEAYKNVKGGLFFKSKDELISSTSLWKVILHHNKMIGITVYKAKHGLKLVALAVSMKAKELAKTALRKVVKADLKQCWMELSEAAEKFVMGLGGDKYIIPNRLVASIIDKEVGPTSDGIHYMRNIMGEEKQKVLLGTIKIAS